MTSPREWQLIGLNTLFINLQRLHVYDRSNAMIDGTQPDEARVTALREWMDTVVGHFTAVIGGADLDVSAQEALKPLAPWVRDEVARYYAQHDQTAPLRQQAAFGAAHVFASDYQTKGERAIADAVGDERQADRLMQYAPLMATLVSQANTAVAAAARGELSAEVEGYITQHVKVAVGDESRVALQVGAVPAMLDGRDPRG